MKIKINQNANLEKIFKKLNILDDTYSKKLVLECINELSNQENEMIKLNLKKFYMCRKIQVNNKHVIFFIRSKTIFDKLLKIFGYKND